MFCSFVVEINQKLNIEIMEKFTIKCSANNNADRLEVSEGANFKFISFEMFDKDDITEIILSRESVLQLIEKLQEVEQTMI
jgi:hypothetical protein